jgi:hypothetical protein
MSDFIQEFSRSATAPYAYFHQGATYWRPDTHVTEAYNVLNWDSYATAAAPDAPGDWTVTIDVTDIPNGDWELVIRDQVGVARDPDADPFIATRTVTFAGGTVVGGAWYYSDRSGVETVEDNTTISLRNWRR